MACVSFLPPARRDSNPESVERGAGQTQRRAATAQSLFFPRPCALRKAGNRTRASCLRLRPERSGRPLLAALEPARLPLRKRGPAPLAQWTATAVVFEPTPRRGERNAAYYARPKTRVGLVGGRLLCPPQNDHPRRGLQPVGFEPTPPKRLRPERSALDHSAKTAAGARASIPGGTRTRNLPLRRGTRYPLRHRDNAACGEVRNPARSSAGRASD